MIEAAIFVFNSYIGYTLLGVIDVGKVGRSMIESIPKELGFAIKYTTR